MVVLSQAHVHALKHDELLGTVHLRYKLPHGETDIPFDVTITAAHFVPQFA